jgi:hypothetical protein
MTRIPGQWHTESSSVIGGAMEQEAKQDARLVTWVQTWQRATQPLEALRRAELVALHTTQTLLNLADAFESCRLHSTPLLHSGLVTQQAFFRRLRP